MLFTFAIRTTNQLKVHEIWEGKPQNSNHQKIRLLDKYNILVKEMPYTRAKVVRTGPLFGQISFFKNTN